MSTLSTTTILTGIESQSPHHSGDSEVGVGSASGNSPFKVSPWWPRAPALRPRSCVLEVLAVLVALALLLAFSQVVHHSVLRGEQLRQAMAEHNAATHHCKSLAANGSGDACLRLLNAPASAGITPTTSITSFAAR